MVRSIDKIKGRLKWLIRACGCVVDFRAKEKPAGAGIWLLITLYHAYARFDRSAKIKTGSKMIAKIQMVNTSLHSPRCRGCCLNYFNMRYAFDVEPSAINWYIGFDFFGIKF